MGLFRSELPTSKIDTEKQVYCGKHDVWYDKDDICWGCAAEKNPG